MIWFGLHKPVHHVVVQMSIWYHYGTHRWDCVGIKAAILSSCCGILYTKRYVLSV